MKLKPWQWGALGVVAGVAIAWGWMGSKAKADDKSLVDDGGPTG